MPRIHPVFHAPTIALLVTLTGACSAGRGGGAVEEGPSVSTAYTIEVLNPARFTRMIFYDAGLGAEYLGNVPPGSTERFVIAGPPSTTVRIIGAGPGDVDSRGRLIFGQGVERYVTLRPGEVNRVQLFD